MKFLKGLLTLIVVFAGIAVFLLLPWPGLVAIAILLGLWMALSRRGQQAASVAAIGIATLAQRAGSAAVIVIGIAGVVGVLVAMLAMGRVTPIRSTYR